MNIPDHILLETAKDEISQAWIQVDSHHLDGEDHFLSIAESFPHGIQDLTFVVFNKARRVVGYEMKGNYRKVREELQDIINYTAFALAFMRIEPDTEKEPTDPEIHINYSKFVENRNNENSSNPTNPTSTRSDGTSVSPDPRSPS